MNNTEVEYRIVGDGLIQKVTNNYDENGNLLSTTFEGGKQIDEEYRKLQNG